MLGSTEMKGEGGRNPRLVDDSTVEAVQGIQLEQSFPLVSQKQLHAAVFSLTVSSPRLQCGLQFVQALGPRFSDRACGPF